MATALTVLDVTEAAQSLGLTDADQAAGNYFANPDGNVFLVCQNTDGTNSATVTVVAQDVTEEVAGFGTMAKANVTVTLAANALKILGPFQKRAFNDSSDRVQITITGTAAASVNVAAVRSTLLRLTV